LFYQLLTTVVNGVLQSTVVAATGFISRTGRQDLYFQYRHNSPLTNVIDPGITNIIDLYLVNQEYYTAYQNYIKDTTGTVPQPAQPTIAELSAAYSSLDDYKMISDNLIFNSVLFKPLFGAKADPALRGTIKVIRALNTVASDSEIRSQVISFINEYFTIDKWDFGSTFFFSELAGYLHQNLGSIISSIVLVPINPLQTFGDLYEIRSAPNEIFVSAATVNDIEVVNALTQSTLRSQSAVQGLYPISSLGSSLSQTGEY
jgi:hypothetical protein